LVVAVSWIVVSVVRWPPPPADVPVFFVLPFVAAFLIGLRFRSWSWMAAPPVVFTILFMAIALTTAPDRGDDDLGLSGGLRVVIYGLLGLAAGGILFSIPAILGALWGTRHKTTTPDSTTNSLNGDAST
jgi:hypothetical protein